MEVIQSSASGWSAGIISGSGMTNWQSGASETKGELSKDNVNYKAIPHE